MAEAGVAANGRNKYTVLHRSDEPELDAGSEGQRKSSASESERRRIERFVYTCAIFASLNAILLGYDVGVMSGAIIYIQKDLHITEFQEEILVGCLSVVSLLGSLSGGRTSDAIGRKWTMGLGAIVFQIGAAIMTFAPSFTVLMIGRLLAGVGIGFGAMVSAVYIAEISPAAARGTLTSLPEICINLGILLGYVSNYAFSGFSEHINWRIMLGVGILPSVFIGFALFVIPESPRWLMMEKRVPEARAVLLQISESEAEVEERLAEIEEAAGLLKSMKSEEKAVWRELLNPSPAVRRMLYAGCGIQMFQQITGIDATVYYSPAIFRDAGIKSDQELLAATVAVGFTKTVFILVAIFLIDKVGRKPLLYVSTVGMTICLFLLGIALSLKKHALGLMSPRVGIDLAIFAVCGNVAFFSIGMGPICWVLSSEIFPLRLRAQASALGQVGGRVSSGLVSMSFLSMARVISVAGMFFVFAAISTTSVLFVYFCVPETKGKTLEQIEIMFECGKEWRGGEIELDDTQKLIQGDKKSLSLG
ncbi:probable polyol transporter 4 isoform X2 [Phragmites australis]|uniref:probable polyol transporter 4 isoform X2 n=1 Tax=Phragmites australis TaxID=29695 RepID=UPI002D7987BE|nr:probable polyol transporter 4 isoform X2 [Phragmites australis]